VSRRARRSRRPVVRDLPGKLVSRCSNSASARLLDVLLAGRSEDAQSLQRSLKQAPIYHPKFVGGRPVLAILSHDASSTDLYDLGDDGGGPCFAEGINGHAGPVLRSPQFRRDALAGLGWHVREGQP